MCTALKALFPPMVQLTGMKKLWKRIAAFFLDMGKSCYDMEWYREIRRRKPSLAFAYLALMLGVMAVVTGLMLAPEVRGYVRGARAVIAEKIPDGASFAVTDGVFSTSLEPATEIDVGGFAVVIDPSYDAETPPDAFKGRVGAYVGKTAAIYQDDVDWRAFRFTDVKDVTFTKADMLSWIDENGGTIVVVATSVYAVVQFVALLLASLLFAFLGAVAIMVMGRLSGTRLPLAAWYACGLHALTLPTIVDLAGTRLGMDLPLVYPILFFMIMLSVLVDERSSPVSRPDVPGPA